jgi:hypothetical protein
MNLLKCVDIVGLEKDTNGRSCNQHDICGRSVVIGDVLVLTKTIVTIDGKAEGAVSAQQVRNGEIGCRVGFVSKAMIARAVEGLLVQVIELYSQSQSRQDRNRSHRNGGVALAS